MKNFQLADRRTFQEFFVILYDFLNRKQLLDILSTAILSNFHFVSWNNHCEESNSFSAALTKIEMYRQSPFRGNSNPSPVVPSYAGPNSPFRWSNNNNDSKKYVKQEGNTKKFCGPTVKVTNTYSQGREGSPSQFLRDYCQKNRLPEPTFKTISLGKGAEVSYNCKVTVGDACGQDPTARDKTITEAQDHASTLLLAKLETLKPAMNQAGAKLSSNVDWEVVMGRIKNILELKPNGMWDTKVESQYVAKFNEQMPFNWFEFAKGCDYFQVPNPNAKIIDIAPITTLPIIQLPECELLQLLVTSVEDTDKVWVNFVGNGCSDQLYVLTKDLKAAVECGAVQFGMTLVHKGTYCLARLESNFARVQILCSEKESALCFLIDTGERLVIPFADLALLPCKSKNVAPQAFRFGLHSVGEFACGDQRMVMLLSSYLLNKLFYSLCLKTEKQVEIILFESPSLDGNPINSIIIEEIVCTILPPNLPEIPLVQQVAVSHVTEDLAIFVQPRPHVARWLHAELQAACSELFQQQSPKLPLPGDVCIAVIINEGNDLQPVTFKRASVLTTKQAALCTIADVLLVDSGEVLSLPQFRLKNFPICHIDFKKIRPQAVKCLLIPSKMKFESPEQLFKLIPENRLVNLCTIVPETADSLPVVDIQLY